MTIRDEFFSAAFYRPLIFTGVRILFIFAFAYLAIFLTRRTILGLRGYVVKAMLRTEGGSEYEIQKRAQTVGDVLRKSIVSAIWVVACIMVLQELNFDVKPLLAGAGIIGVALGFGAQSLVKDVLGGFFLLLENQIRVNDVAVINGTGGLVEEINLRTTILRGEDGAVHVFPNGNITSLANLTRDYSYYVFSVSLDYKEDTDRATSVLNDIAAQLMTEEPYRSAVLAPLEMMGVDRFADSGVIVKARFKTQPMKQWLVGREMNRRIKIRFDQEGISMPCAARPVYLVQDTLSESGGKRAKPDGQ